MYATDAGCSLIFAHMTFEELNITQPHTLYEEEWRISHLYHEYLHCQKRFLGIHRYLAALLYLCALGTQRLQLQFPTDKLTTSGLPSNRGSQIPGLAPQALKPSGSTLP